MKTFASIVVAVLSGLVGGVAGTVLVIHRLQPAQQQVVRSRSFELVDAGGGVVSRWGIDQDHNPVLVFGAPATAPPSPQTTNTLSLDDRESQRVAIGLTGDGGPTLMFRGNDRKARASLLVDGFGKPFFLLYDENSWRISLGIRGSDTPGRDENNWGLDFYPNRAAIGMTTTKAQGNSYVHGYLQINRDNVRFP